MATEFGGAVRQRPQDSDQMLHGDRPLESPSPGALSVESTQIPALRAGLSNGHSQPVADLGDDRPDRLVPVNVLVRINVGRMASYEPPERLELAQDLGSDGA